jgi:hypothetical protein
MQAFAPGTSWLWTTTGGYAKGTYVIHVWASNQGAATSPYEVYGSSTYSLT